MNETIEELSKLIEIDGCVSFNKEGDHFYIFGYKDLSLSLHPADSIKQAFEFCSKREKPAEILEEVFG